MTGLCVGNLAGSLFRSDSTNCLFLASAYVVLEALSQNHVPSQVCEQTAASLSLHKKIK